MFPVFPELNGSEDSISSRHRIRTKVWGISLGSVVKPINAYTTEKERHALEAGQKYKLKVKKKFYITQAVLDPESDPDIPYDTKFVQIMLKHNQLEHILAVLKHGEIYQTSLNMRFDRDDITFYIKGKGTVHLLGYEILSEDDEEEEGEKESEEELESKTSSKGAETFEKPSKSGKKHKSAKLGTEKKSEETFSNVISKRLRKTKAAEPEMFAEDESDDESSPDHMKLLETEFSSEDDEDEDFSLSEEETDDEMQQEEESEDDVEDVDANELRKLLSDPDEAESDDDDDSRDIPGPSCSQKRKKRHNKGKSQKRSKQEESPKPGSSKISEEKNQKASSSTDDSSDDVSPKPPVVKKKVKTEAKLTKAERLEATKRILEGGVETRDLKPGHGPVATKGKMLHVYYMGRLPNKAIFDSVTGPEKRPFSFKLGEKQVIRGWEIGLEGMKAGGKRIIKVPPKMGYGNKNLDGIPANSTLTFIVELQAVT